MGNAGKGVRICLFLVVFAAIVIGLIYYYIEMENQLPLSEGTLISNVGNDWCLLWE